MNNKTIRVKTILLALLLLFAGNAFAQTGSIDLDLTSGDQGTTSFTGIVGDTYQFELRASGVTNITGYEVTFTYNTDVFTASSSFATASSGEGNILEKDGASLTTAPLEFSSTSGNMRTVTMAVALPLGSAGVSGDGLLGVVTLNKNSFTAGQSTSITFDKFDILTNGGVATATAGQTATVTFNSPPSAPSITSPADGATVSVQGQPSATVDVAWSASTDADGDTVNYTWQVFGPTGTLLTEVNNGTNTSITFTMQQLEDLLASAGVASGSSITVTHKVIASDGSNSTESAVSTATFVRGVVNASPTAATNLNPADGSTVSVEGDPASAITISWDAATDADGDALTYTWQLSTGQTFSNILLNVGNSSDTSLNLTVGEVNNLLRDQLNVQGGASIPLYHRVIVSDGVNADVVSASAKVTFVRNAVTANEDTELPEKFALKGNYPNPFNPSTTIEFDMPENGAVSVELFDVQGRLMMTVPAQQYAAGSGLKVQVNAQNLTSGIYIYRLTANSAKGINIATGQMTLLK